MLVQIGSRVLVIFLGMALLGCHVTSGGAGETSMGSPSYPPHIELHFLDKGQRVYLGKVRPLELQIGGALRHESFYVDPHRIVFVLAGVGTVRFGTHVIEVGPETVRIDGGELEKGRSAVVTEEGRVVPGAFIRTFD